MKKYFAVLALVLCLVLLNANFAFAGTWSSQTSGSTDPLTSISFATSSIGLAGGYNGASTLAILKMTTDGGSNWVDAGTAPTLTISVSDSDVSTYYDSSSGNVYAVSVFDSFSARGKYYTVNDLENVSTWTEITVGSGFGYAIKNVKQVDSSTIYTIGTNTGNVAMAKNTTLLTNTSGLTGNFYGIDCTDANTCWAVGIDSFNNGLAANTTNGSSYTGGSITGGTGITFTGIDMVSSTVGYAVGNSGSIFKCSANNCASASDWTDLTSGIAENLNGISCTDASTCWVVGASGKVYKTTTGGTSWTSETSGTANDLYSVSFYDANHGWASGASGTIISQQVAATPVTTASPAGGTYNTAQSVTLTSDIAATTYYTTDGTTPTEASSVYSTPINISTNTTLKFFSKAGSSSESTKTETYVIDSTAPVTTALPAAGEYDSAQTVTLTATDSNTGVAATYYTTDGTTPTTSSTRYTSPITISQTTTLKFFSTDNAGNSETVNTAVYTIETTPASIQFNKKINLEGAILDATYHSELSNTDLIFYRLPRNSAIENLYIKITRNKTDYDSNFKKKLSYPGFVTLTSNIGEVKRDVYSKVGKHIKFRITIRYSQTKIDQKNLKEGKLRLFYQDRDGIWKGPFTVYQNIENNVIKFKIRNYLLNSNTTSSLGNRTFAPTFYFQDLTKIKFIIAEKDALKQLKRLMLE